jgi:hypothetical protein
VRPELPRCVHLSYVFYVPTTPAPPRRDSAALRRGPKGAFREHKPSSGAAALQQHQGQGCSASAIPLSLLKHKPSNGAAASQKYREQGCLASAMIFFPRAQAQQRLHIYNYSQRQ